MQAVYESVKIMFDSSACRVFDFDELEHVFTLKRRQHSLTNGRFFLVRYASHAFFRIQAQIADDYVSF